MSFEIKYQKYVSFPDRSRIGYHVLAPIAAGATTLTVPRVTNDTAANSCKQMVKNGQTVLGSPPTIGADEYSITITFTAAEVADAENQEIVVVTSHVEGHGNFTPEDTTPYSQMS
jgi:hypothetical protein